MTTTKIDIDLDAAALEDSDVTVVQTKVEDLSVVFVPFMDTELRINQTTTYLHKGRAVKLTRDQARILLEAEKGYIKE